MSADSNEPQAKALSETEALELELEAARTARHAREKAKRKLDLAKELAEERRIAADEAKLEELEAKYGERDKDIKAVPTAGGLVVVKKPVSSAFERYQNSKMKAADGAVLARPCVIHPSKEAFDELCDRYPATMMRATSAVIELAGYRQKDIEEK